MVLASPEAGPELQPSAESSVEGQALRRSTTLHCGYTLAADGATAALTWTDSIGELAHGEVLDCNSDCSDGNGDSELCEDVLEATIRVRLRLYQLYSTAQLPGVCMQRSWFICVERHQKVSTVQSRHTSMAGGILDLPWAVP